MSEALADLFSLVMYPLYDLTGNWWVSIALFTVLIKIVLMPLSLWCHWNSLTMVRFMPEINRIKVKYYGDAETIGEKQNALNKANHYHPLLSLVPLAIQVFILFGLVALVRRITGSSGAENFLGMVPATDGGASWAMPPLAGLSSVVLGLAQNRISPLQREQSRREQLFTNGTSVALSLVLAVWVATGVAFYWICSNLMAIGVQLLCNVIIKPEKHVDYPDLRASQAELADLDSLSKDDTPWYKPNPLAKREKAEYKRFFSVVNKHFVVYSEKSGFWKYFEPAIMWMLHNSNVCVHYVTGDPNDQVFQIHEREPRLIPYYIGEKRLITLMMKMDADVVLMTTPDLDNFYIKRSYVRSDIKYVYQFHHMTSIVLTGHEDGYDHFDALLATGPHIVEEIRANERLRDVPRKDLPSVGYGLLDRQIEDYAARNHEAHEKPVVLLAPSWQEDNILDLCAEATIDPLLGHGYKVVVRPHPEYTKRYRARWDALQAKYADRGEDEIYFEQDFSSSDSILDADVLVTDWSSVFCEFSFVTLQPSVFIDTPMKVGNTDWEKYGCEPTDISLRNQMGRSVAVENLAKLPDIVREMLENPESWRSRIEEVRGKTVFNLGHGGETAGQYLLDAILKAQEKKGGKVDAR